MSKKYIEDDGLFMAIKFGKEKHIKDLQKGQLYMKNLQYFIDLEKNNSTGSEGQGDMYEGQLVQTDVTVVLSDPDTHIPLAQTQATLATIGFGYQMYPVFCMFMLDSRNFIEDRVEGDQLIKSYRFTNEQIDRIARDFGDYALILNADEFVHRVKNKLAADFASECSVEPVRYYETNEYKYFQDIHNSHMRAAFWKRKDFAFQQEFRILVHKKVTDNFMMNIDDISDISQLFKTKDLLNSQIDIIFNAQNGADTHA